MKNCKNCGSNDRNKIEDYLVCSHCGGKIKVKRQLKGNGSMNLEVLLEKYDIQKSIFDNIGYQARSPQSFIKIDDKIQFIDI